jgi:hypothetical protein
MGLTLTAFRLEVGRNKEAYLERIHLEVAPNNSEWATPLTSLMSKRDGEAVTPS